MIFARILEGLTELEVTGAQARDAARLGFLEWVLTLDAAQAPQCAAQAALRRVPAGADLSPAAAAFVGYVGDAAALPAGPAIRRGGRRRVLH